MDDVLKVTFKWPNWMYDGLPKMLNDFVSKLASFAYTRPKRTNLSLLHIYIYRSLNNSNVHIKQLLSETHLERDCSHTSGALHYALSYLNAYE